ncbi:MAG: hypothetical protein MZV65_38925 [Chromatiales bacterium]|nr:hypothetical protein [Chromatiales bacterium]
MTTPTAPFIYHGAVNGELCGADVAWTQEFVPLDGYSADDRPVVTVQDHHVYVTAPLVEGASEYGPVSPGVLTLTPTVHGPAGAVALEPLVLEIGLPLQGFVNVYIRRDGIWQKVPTSNTGATDVPHVDAIATGILNYSYFELSGAPVEMAVTFESSELVAGGIVVEDFFSPGIRTELNAESVDLDGFVAGFLLVGCDYFDVGFDVLYGDETLGRCVVHSYYDVGCG